MRVFVILLLLLPPVCPAMTQTQSTSAPQGDSLSRYVHQQLDSIKLELQKAESQKLAEEARALRNDVACMMEWIVGLIGGLVTLIAIILAIAGVYWFRTQKQVHEAQKEAVKSTCEKVEKDLKPQVEVVLEQIRDDARVAANEKVKDLKLPEIGQPISDEERRKLRDVDDRLKRLERVGGVLTAEDHVLRGRNFVERRRFPLAVDAFEAALREDENNLEALFGLGFSLANLKQHDRAESILKRVIELDPVHSRALYNLACIYAHKKERSLILETLRRACDSERFVKTVAKSDSDFQDFWDDPDFKKIVGEG